MNDQHDAEAAVITRYQRGLLLMLRVRTGGDVQLAEDICQDAFRVLIERMRGKGLDEPEKVKGFVYQTAINILKGDIRKRRRRGTEPDSARIDIQPDSGGGALQRLLQAESAQAVRALIDKLNMPRDRELLRRFYLLEHDKTQICAALGLGARDFDRAISRARQRFKLLVEKKNT